jgi:hypothetical protein
MIEGNAHLERTRVEEVFDCRRVLERPHFALHGKLRLELCCELLVDLGPRQ